MVIEGRGQTSVVVGRGHTTVADTRVHVDITTEGQIAFTEGQILETDGHEMTTDGCAQVIGADTTEHRIGRVGGSHTTMVDCLGQVKIGTDRRGHARLTAACASMQPNP